MTAMPPAMMLHIAAGGVGLASGFAALAFRKGERLHRIAGTAFFVAMLFMSGIGAVMAVFLPNRPTILVGVLTFYLVATAWMTVRREEGRIGRFEVAALAIVAVVATLDFIAGWVAAGSPKGAMDHIPYQMIFVFGGVAALAAVTDLRVIRRGGISGAPRIARHLWRMCVALLIATTSFFLGQQKVLPEVLHGSPILFVPILAPLVLMIFWLFRVRFSKAFAQAPQTLEAAG
ncbi:hypothetical protein [Phenylobacterium sp.]|uniref:hypothetical protein n=1 Tax=Phenylobacterium sp. TaxID=1871053 RepID=UPI002FC9C730